MSIAESIRFAAEAGLQGLTDRISCSKDLRSTHTVVSVENLSSDPALCAGIASYVVALRARSIDTALRIRAAALPDRPETKVDLRAEIRKMCGVELPAGSPAEFIQNQRDPWLSEGFSHMLIHAAAVHPNTHPPGTVVGAWTAHTRPGDPGLDVATLYRREGLLGVGIVETKACQNSAPAAVQEATRYFREIDRGQHSDRLRQAVDMLSAALPPDEAASLPLTLWRDERSYIANPHYESGLNGTSWKRRRRTLAELQPPANRIVILACAIGNFRGFFNRVADSALEFVEGL